jgi:hypothetical protein
LKSNKQANIAASVRQRLLNKARATERPFAELIQYFAMERFLYRLSKSAHSRNFILKGALMLSVWEAPHTRPTMDIDMLGQINNEINSVISFVREVCIQQVEPDGIMFDVDSVAAENIREDADYEGIRVRFRGSLDTARIAIQLDIGFGDVVFPKVESIDYPILLDFPAPVLYGYSKESTIAEKFESMVKLGIINSRMKDFFDIWLLSRQFDFEGSTLATAIKQTFAKRGTELKAEPIPLTRSFAEDISKSTQWRAFIRNNKISNVPQDFKTTISAVASFLMPIAECIVGNKSFEGVWKAPGPWRKSPD